MSTKILFTDLDGTLLNSDKNISEGNLKAICDMTSQGHKFVIATGRPITSAIQIAEKYGWTGEGYYISSYNGGLIYDCHSNKSIVEHSMPLKYVRYILDEAYKAGIHAHTYDDKNVVSEHETQELLNYTRTIMVPPIVVDDACKYLTREPIKVITISRGSHEVLDPFRQKIIDYAGDEITTVFSHSELLEFAHPMATKGRALEYMCKHFDIPIKNSVAAGDEENDLSMITAAGTGVAMCNATEAVKAAADYITCNDNNHDGIAEIINRFILN